VKILDFGLAKPFASSEDVDVTRPGNLTDPGTTLGTVAYMSPEQARGLTTLSPQSDQFAFGLVLYEMVTGRRAFSRPSSAETMTAIIRDDAEPLPPSVPAPVRWVIERCLAKDPAERYDSTRDLARDLKLAPNRLSGVNGTQTAAPPASTRPRRRAWGAAGLAGLAIAAITFGATRFLGRAPEPPSWTGVMLGGSEMALNPRLSPDGHLVAFLAMVDGLTQVAVMTPESGNWAVLTHDRHGSIFNLGWSPDGTRIYYDRYADVPQGIFSVPVLGGDERPALENAFAPEPLPDGSLLIVRQNAERRFQLHRFWPGTGRVQALPLLTAQNFVWVHVRALPDGTEAVAWGEPLGQTTSSPGYYLVDLATESTRRVGSAEEESGFTISADGTSIIGISHAGALSVISRIPVRGTQAATPLLTLTGTVWNLDAGADGGLYLGLVDRPVDVVRFAPDGTRVERLASFPQIPDSSSMAVLPDGRAILPVRASAPVRLMVVQQGKDPVPLVNTTEETAAPVAACGSREVALMIGPPPHESIAFAEPASGRLVRTLEPRKGPVTSVSCSPDGHTVYFSADGVVWSMPASGLPEGGEARRIRAGDSVVADPSGGRLIVQVLERTQLHRFSVPLDGGPEQEIPTDTSVSFDTRPLSPNALHGDGRLLTSLNPRDAWFNAPAVVDTLTGRATRIPSDNLSDYQSIGWTPDGQVMALRIGTRATLWKLQATSR